MVLHDISTVEAFIRRYNTTVEASDFSALPSYFDAQILVVTPTASRCLTRGEFVAAAEARARWFDSPAVPRTTLVGQSTVACGGHYWLASARWTLAMGEDAQPKMFELHSDFIVRSDDGALWISAYLTRQDLPRLLAESAEHGG
jgi:hypothetical protein